MMTKKQAAQWIATASKDHLFYIGHAIPGADFQAGQLRDGDKSGYYILIPCTNGEIYAEIEAGDSDLWGDCTLAPLYDQLRDLASEILEG